MVTGKRAQVWLYSIFIIFSGYSTQTFSETEMFLPKPEKSNSSITNSVESLLENIRLGSKQRAAEATHQLSLIAASKDDLDGAYRLINEAIALLPESI